MTVKQCLKQIDNINLPPVEDLYYLIDNDENYVEFDYCYDCAKKKANIHEFDEWNIRSSWEPCDHPTFCYTCGVRLNTSLTKEGMELEIEHFEENGINGLDNVLDLKFVLEELEVSDNYEANSMTDRMVERKGLASRAIRIFENWIEEEQTKLLL